MLSEAAGIEPAGLAGLGDQVGDAVGARWPDLVEEIDGIASGAGERAEELLAVNARTELLGGAVPAAECSLIGHVRGETVRLAQNWDWHPELAASGVVWAVEGAGGWFTTVTEAGMLAKLGVSGAGIACGLNMLTSSLDGGVGGVPIHVVLRVVLDRCGSLADALALLTQTPVSASSSITLAASGPDGAALVAVELSPGGAALCRPDADGVLVHTNHFVHPPARGRDTQPAEHPGTLLRHRHLVEALAAGAEPTAALRTHLPRTAPVCRHADSRVPWPDRRATLLCMTADPGRPALAVSDGPPCETPLEPVPLPRA